MSYTKEMYAVARQLKCSIHTLESAPDLLEACEKVIARLNQLTQQNPMEQAIVRELQQAINQAEGK